MCVDGENYHLFIIIIILSNKLIINVFYFHGNYLPSKRQCSGFN